MTSAHVDDLLPLLALPELARGDLGAAERAAAEAHLATCTSCTAGLDELREALGTLPVELPGAAPSGRGRALLLDALSPDAPLERRIAGYRRRFQSLFDLDDAAYDALMAKAARTDEWLPMLPGMSLIPFAVGPARTGGDASLFRFQAGTRFPPHRHPGDEIMFFMQGGIRDDVTAEEQHPGDALLMTLDTDHGFSVVGDEDCVCGVLLYGGGPIFSW